jgi:hypothetical protein
MRSSAIRSISIAYVALGCSLLGCSAGDFPTAAVTGKVLCKGQPVADAMVFFEPLINPNSESASVGKQAFSITDAEGQFTLTTYAPNDGAVVGKHRVRVAGPNVRCECSLNEERDVMEVEVKAGQQNAFVVELPPATQADRRRSAQQAAQEED